MRVRGRRRIRSRGPDSEAHGQGSIMGTAVKCVLERRPDLLDRPRGQGLGCFALNIICSAKVVLRASSARGRNTPRSDVPRAEENPMASIACYHKSIKLAREQ